MKNLVMIHLESLDYRLFMNYPDLFREVHKVRRDGLFFDHYYSTATSTLMVIGDIVYGGKEQYDACTSLSDVPEDYFYKESIFDELKRKGYKTGLFIYPDGGDRESAEMRHIAGFQNEMVLRPDYNQFLDSIKLLINNEPFAIMACNYISNISINDYTDQKNVLSGTDRWKRGYIWLDKYVGDVLNLLKAKNQLNNTCVILYGDHGDDFWGHGMHGGLTHAIEPFASLIHTPMIILDKDIGKGIDKSLFCATDLRQKISKILGLGNVEKDIQNTYVIARSSYAAQPVRKDTFNKAYSITDGKFLMLVSNDGLELYDMEMDFQCTFNFLELFLFDKALIRYNTEKGEAIHFHYTNFMNEREIALIRQLTYYFRDKLYKEVLRLYEIAGRTEQDMVKEMNFCKIHYKNK